MKQNQVELLQEMELFEKINRLAIIGNGGGGKSTLAKKLAKLYDLPLTHVDSIQFLPNMKVRKQEETSKILRDLSKEKSWLIDGFGTLDAVSYTHLTLPTTPYV